MRPVPIATWSDLADRTPAYALVENIDLVVIRYDDQVSVMYGRCHHRGALLDAYPQARAWQNDSMFFGGVHAVRRNAKGAAEAMGDPRRDGTALIS